MSSDPETAGGWDKQKLARLAVAARARLSRRVRPEVGTEPGSGARLLALAERVAAKRRD